MIRIFKWNGQYFGFISNGYLFTAAGTYVGWVEGNMVWKSNGQFLGELTNGEYILKKIIQIPPMRKIPRMIPFPPLPPLPPLNRLGKIPKIGWRDALEELE